tara:strand:+ start:51 stop:596 length:546 start_codon:yes stop_codon:yes gene_type:complete
MAVPNSGVLTMEGIGQERKFGTYGTGNLTGEITYSSLINGGGDNSFPALNTCAGNPTPTYSINSWYGYDQDLSCFQSVMNVGSWSFSGNNYYGFIQDTYGSMTNQDFDGKDILRLGWQDGGGGEVFLWYYDTPFPDWTSITINGTVFPAKALWTSGFGQFRYSTSTNPFGTSGNITITAVY